MNVKGDNFNGKRELATDIRTHIQKQTRFLKRSQSKYYWALTFNFKARGSLKEQIDLVLSWGSERAAKEVKKRAKRLGICRATGEEEGVVGIFTLFTIKAEGI